MYIHQSVKNPHHPMHVRYPWAETAMGGFEAAVTTKEHGGFPCTFSQAALRRKTLYYAFINDVDDADERARLRTDLSRYLDRCKTVKSAEHLHVLLIFVQPEDPALSLASYHAQAWALMADWMTYDPDPWPATVPKDPHDPYWALCFRSTQLFVNVSCPAHVRRRSRNLGRSLVLVTQPRSSFDMVAGPNARGDELREIIRARMDVYDSIPRPPSLGTYHRGDLEWPQYALEDTIEDDAQQVTRRCPLHHAP